MAIAFYASAYSVVIPPDLQNGSISAIRLSVSGKETQSARWFRRDRDIERGDQEQPESREGLATTVDSFIDDLVKAISDGAGSPEADWNRHFWFVLGTIELAEKAFQLRFQRSEALSFLPFNARRLREDGGSNRLDEFGARSGDGSARYPKGIRGGFRQLAGSCGFLQKCHGAK